MPQEALALLSPGVLDRSKKKKKIINGSNKVLTVAAYDTSFITANKKNLKKISHINCILSKHNLLILLLEFFSLPINLDAQPEVLTTYRIHVGAATATTFIFLFF